MSALLFAVALAANLRAGHVQITYYVTVAAGIWWLVQGFQAAREGELQSFLRGTGMLVLGSILGLMMVAQPYLSHAEIKPFTIRGSAPGGVAGGMAWEYAMAWSQGVGEMLTVLVADAYGGASPTYWGAKTFTGGPHYFGVIALATAVLACVRVRDRDTLALAIGVVAMTFFALGENLSVLNKPMFAVFPLFDAFRVPETWLSMVALLVALLAARGLASARRRKMEERPLMEESWVRVCIGMGAVLLVLNLFGPSLLSFEKPLEREQLISQIQRQYPGVSAADPQVAQVVSEEISRRSGERVELFQADALRSLMVLAGFFLLMALYHRRTLPWFVALSLALLLVVIDLTGVARRHINENSLNPAATVESSVPEYGFDAWLKAQREVEGGEGSFRVLSLEGGQHPVQNARPSFHYESLGGYSGAKLRLFQDVLDELLFAGPTGLNTGVLTMLDVEYLVSGRGAPGWQLVHQDDATGMSVFQNPIPTHRAFFVDSVMEHADAPALWAALNAVDFDPRTTAHVYPGTGLPGNIMSVESLVISADSTGGSQSNSVDLAEYAAHDMTFQVSTSQDRLLVVSEVYYPPGWTATVDGAETPIHQVNHVLRGVVVPAGDHEVRLEFAPSSHSMGQMITAAGTGITYVWLLVLGVLAWKRRDDSAGNADPEADDDDDVESTEDRG